MDINKEIQIISDRIIAEKLPAMTETAVTKMLEGVIEDIFSKYSPLAKEVKAKIEKQLNVNLQSYDLIDYNALIAKTINDNLLQQVNMDSIIKLTQNTIGLVNKHNIKLSEIIDMFIRTAEESGDEREGEISLFIEKNTNHDWIEVSVDMEGGKDQDECGIRFLISIKRGAIFSFHTKDYWTKLNPITPSKLINLNNLEQIIFRLYSAQVKIEIDDTEFDKGWSKYN